MAQPQHLPIGGNWTRTGLEGLRDFCHPTVDARDLADLYDPGVEDDGMIDLTTDRQMARAS